MKFKSLLSLALVLFALANLVGCSSEKPSTVTAAETIRGISLYQAANSKVPDVLVLTGTVHAWETSQVSAQFMGNVTAVNVREGDAVKQGQVLATIDAVQAQAGLDRAQAMLTAAEHDLAASESERSLAEATLRRYDMLYQKKSVSPQEFDEVKARATGAAARADAARSGQAQAKAAVAQAQAAFSYTKVRAPFDGVVTERRVDPGALAAPGTPLFTVESTGRFRLEASVDEGSLRFVRMGQQVPVLLDAYPGESLAGSVAQVVPAADPGTRSFTVKIDLQHSPNLRSGLFGRAQFSRGERTALLIPSTAVVDRGALKSVYVVNAEKIATLRYVTIGSPSGDRVEVLSGLSPNDAIVQSPGERELAGKRIEVQ